VTVAVPRAAGLAAGAAAVLVLAATAGCGVPAETAPRAIESPAVLPIPASPPVTRQAAGPDSQRLCLTREARLVEVTRPVSGPASVQETVRDLLAGPTEVESGAGLNTALGGTPLVTGVRLEDGIAVVGLRRDTEGSSRADDVLALGQVVCTLTARGDVVGVVFERAGERVAVPRGDGSLATGPLRGGDFDQLRAPSP
jgi:spore germination protein GerM